MAEASFQPASPVLAYADSTVQQAGEFQNIFQRQQAINQQKQLFPLQLQQAAANLALTNQEVQTRQNDNALWQLKNQAGLFKNQAEADNTSAQLQSARNNFQLGLFGQMRNMITPTDPTNPQSSPFYNDLQNLQNYYRDNPNDWVGFNAQKAAFDAKYAPVAAASPEWKQWMDFQMAPLLSTQLAHLDLIKGLATAWGNVHGGDMGNFADQKSYLDSLAPEDRVQHENALMFSPTYQAAWQKQADAWQAQAKERAAKQTEMFNAQRTTAAEQANQFLNSTEAQNYSKSATAMKSIKDAIGDGSGGNAFEDINALTEWFKVIDPTLGLRAQQLEDFRKAGTADDQLKAFMQYYGIGPQGIVSPQQRQKILQAAQTSFASRKRDYMIRAENQKSIMKALGPGGSMFADNWSAPTYDSDEGEPPAGPVATGAQLVAGRK
jgi:hypothetical protein